MKGLKDMKTRTKKGICLIVLGLSILNAKSTFAVTEVETKENENTYQRIVKLTKDEENDFLNKLKEKEITRNGVNWNLINVDWNIETTTEVDETNVPKTYSGVKHYQRVGTYSYPDKYRVTAIYRGSADKINPETIYQINYKKVIKEEPKVVEVQEEKKEEISGEEKILFIGTIGFTIFLGIILFKNRKKLNEFKMKK